MFGFDSFQAVRERFQAASAYLSQLYEKWVHAPSPAQSRDAASTGISSQSSTVDQAGVRTFRDHHGRAVGVEDEGRAISEPVEVAHEAPVEYVTFDDTEATVVEGRAKRSSPPRTEYVFEEPEVIVVHRKTNAESKAIEHDASRFGDAAGQSAAIAARQPPATARSSEQDGDSSPLPLAEGLQAIALSSPHATAAATGLLPSIASLDVPSEGWAGHAVQLSIAHAEGSAFDQPLRGAAHLYEEGGRAGLVQSDAQGAYESRTTAETGSPLEGSYHAAAEALIAGHDHVDEDRVIVPRDDSHPSHPALGMARPDDAPDLREGRWERVSEPREAQGQRTPEVPAAGEEVQLASPTARKGFAGAGDVHASEDMRGALHPLIAAGDESDVVNDGAVLWVGGAPPFIEKFSPVPGVAQQRDLQSREELVAKPHGRGNLADGREREGRGDQQESEAEQEEASESIFTA